MELVLEQKLTEAATAMETKSNVLLIKVGQPLDMFAASAWIASFVEFFYGDCAPNLQRPTDITWRELFRYLMRRQELEYHLPDDATNPDIPGGCYRAPLHSRWDTPEFAAIFGDTLRRIQILQTTKGLMQRKDATWKKDLQLLVQAKASDFEKLQETVVGAPRQSLATMMAQPQVRGMPKVHAALKQMMLATATVPLTEGYKMTLRHSGFAKNVHQGSLQLFLTTNLADTYSPIVVALRDGAGEPLGARRVDLSQDAPGMPTLQEMHEGTRLSKSFASVIPQHT